MVMSDSGQTGEPQDAMLGDVLAFEDCYRAIEMKDARFDGWFITAVTDDGHLLPAQLPGEDAPCPQRALLRDCGCGAGGGLSRL